MRVFFSRIIKPLLAIAAAALMAQSLQACKRDQAPQPVEKPTRPETKPADAPAALKPGEVRTVAISVTEKGYEPSPVTLRKGEPVKLVVTRKTDQTCATELVMDEYNIDTKLPLNTPVEIAFTPTKSGELHYGCAMGKMISGTFVVE